MKLNRKAIASSFILVLLCSSIANFADYEEGVEAAFSGDFETAFREFTSAAEDGLSLAQYNLGILYFTGQGVSKNLEEALLILERFDKYIAERVFLNLSNTIEKRSFAYVNRYVKTDMEIASIIFDRKRKIRWAGINGSKYISYFQ